jgi:DNA-binding PucR family transcriptional regulator
MDNGTEPRDELRDELRSLAANLKEALSAAWESEERRRVQAEIIDGLSEMVDTLRALGNEFAQSPTGQRLSADAADLHEQLRRDQVQEKARTQLLEALRKVNSELSRAAQLWKRDTAQGTNDEPG